MAWRNEGTTKHCRGCGEEILIIKTGTCFKTVVVEAEPVWIRLETGGNMYVTPDGRTLFGYEVGDAEDDPDTNLMAAYVPHKGRCPYGCKAPRNRNRRPSGYR